MTENKKQEMIIGSPSLDNSMQFMEEHFKQASLKARIVDLETTLVSVVKTMKKQKDVTEETLKKG